MKYYRFGSEIALASPAPTSPYFFAGDLKSFGKRTGYFTGEEGFHEPRFTNYNFQPFLLVLNKKSRTI
jgi:hypothetical protein